MVLAASGPVETVGGVWAGFLLHAKAEDKTVPLYIEAGMSGRKITGKERGRNGVIGVDVFGNSGCYYESGIYRTDAS